MAVSPTYPGVYVQELPSGVRTIVGVGTSITMFIGTSKKGPMGRPIRCVSYLDFTRNFSDDPSGGTLAEYVKLFFLNGGTDCYVMRIANGASPSTVTLENENGAQVLTLTAKDPGLLGENIRAFVTYSGQQPEATFNIDLFRWEIDPTTSKRTRRDQESWKNLSMNPNSPAYAVDILTQKSKLVNASDPGLVAPTTGFSLSGRPVPDTGAFAADWAPLLGTTVNTNRFQISVNGSPYVDVDLGTVAVGTDLATAAAIKTEIENAFTLKGILGIVVNVSFPAIGGAGSPRRLRIAPAAGNGDVFIRPGLPSATQVDLAVALMLGSAQGGLEGSAFADLRPAPNGLSFRAADPAHLNQLAALAQTAPFTMTLDLWHQATSLFTPPLAMDLTTPTGPGAISVITAAGQPFFEDAGGNFDGVREKLAIIADQVNLFVPAPGTELRWKAEVWGSRLALLPTDAPDNFVAGSFAFVPALAAGSFTNNVKYYSVGAGGLSIGFQASAAAPATDGTPPIASDYDAAYAIIDKEVDLFNLMVLSPDAAVSVQSLYGRASVFCEQRRAFLIMDPPSSWTTAQLASTGVAALRVGLSKSYAALYFPDITIDRQGKAVNLGPAGAMAGLYARIDGTRGVWKAPAGTEADLRGVIGLQNKLSDNENGITNPRAVNTLRIFPNGIVSWGARTMDGDDGFASEYKYVPIRRLALYIEESLYRGLKWVVFEPNDEPLYAQIRLNVGAFMHNLFRQGAFQGATPRDSYFVKCDTESTTQNDRNLGIVNIIVGFAPLKPAEFVILYLQQMAGKIEV